MWTSAWVTLDPILFSTTMLQLFSRPSPNTPRRLYPTPFGSEPREFTLEMVGSIPKVGNPLPSLYFGGFGVSLVTGEITWDGGKNWDTAFPSLETHAPTVTQWQVSSDPRTSQLRVTWPTGETKTWKHTVKKCYLSAAGDATGAAFSLKQ
eukprot:TRINITY_DN66801_c1_g1_i7.p1 TRINITY_DN66801_c1_g1~~TRINITY_DN66801_c1_g1_i7.p1  ORF type:complete len:150 (-),score=23.17 TRINITY_DN66801_c1_g1_i7:73-522(-)